MREINKAAKNIAKVWGIQEIKDAEYRLIRYHLRRDYEDGSMLCNCITGETVFLDKEEAAILNELPGKYDPKMDELIKDHFLVPADYDEYKAVGNLRKALRALERLKENKLKSYTILPTTACNARCYYCFEAGGKTVTMTDETADKIIELIKKNYIGNPIDIEWFGGEPTLGTRHIDRISEGLKKAEIKYYASMVSNGYLFDEAMVQKAKELWNLKRIQITLDGTEEIYNKTKSYVGVSGSPYQKVLKSIELILNKEIAVNIRMNLGKSNADDLYRLIEELYKRFGRNKYLSMYIGMIFDDCGYDPDTYSKDDRVQLIENRSKLIKYISDRFGESYYITGYPMLILNGCMGDSNAAVLITPDAKFCKCMNMVEEFCGDIEKGFANQKLISEWQEISEPYDCKNCEVYPTCIKLKKCLHGNICDEIRKSERITKYISFLDKKYYDFKNKSENERKLKI